MDRWGFGGADVSRTEEELRPSPDLTLHAAVETYRQRAIATYATVRSLPLAHSSDPARWAEDKDLRWVLLHLINETARQAGHADATRELLDGNTGE